MIGFWIGDIVTARDYVPKKEVTNEDPNSCDSYDERNNCSSRIGYYSSLIPSYGLDWVEHGKEFEDVDAENMKTNRQ